MTTVLRRQIMSNPKVVFEALPNRYVIQFKSPGDDWAFIKSKPTLEAAKEYAQQSMDYMSADSASLWRVVDTQPEDDVKPCAGSTENIGMITVNPPITVEAVRVGDETPLTLETYQQKAAKTAIYPLDKADQYLIAGLAGEVGELASIFAKHWRGDGDLNHDHAKAELGDVLWFVAMLAEQLDTDLSTVAQGNLTKLADRAERGKLKGLGDNR